ncbi:unnamed protein product [Amoebophrya sp. A25]|nr:unnamed protein product [Amoebophrya sp. A25]|eukprot:GSA25T00019064001.1
MNKMSHHHFSAMSTLVLPNRYGGSSSSSGASSRPSATSFFLNCDSTYQVRDLTSALRYTMTPPLEHECEYTQKRFDILRREVPEVPPGDKCIERSYIYKGALDRWYKCCTETLGLSGLVDTRPQMACQPLTPLAKRAHLPGTGLARSKQLQCFETRPADRITPGYVNDPTCFCPEGENSGCWCPNPKTECINLGDADRSSSSTGKYSVYYIP